MLIICESIRPLRGQPNIVLSSNRKNRKSTYTKCQNYVNINLVFQPVGKAYLKERAWIMGQGIASKNNWALFLIILTGIVLGGFIGYLTQGISWLGWLSYGQTFGFSEPVVLDLGILVLTFGLTVTINIASIVGVIIGIFIYKKL